MDQQERHEALYDAILKIAQTIAAEQGVSTDTVLMALLNGGN